MDAGKAALLVIDMQNFFTKKGMDMGAFPGFVAKCRKAGILVVFTRHLTVGAGRELEIDGRLEVGPGDLLLGKNRHNAFLGTELDEELRKRGIGTVVITGTMADVCCLATAEGARELGYEAIFCRDYTFGNEEGKRKALGKAKNVMGAEEIRGLLGGK
jgi:nicotinamidase-related amidase